MQIRFSPTLRLFGFYKATRAGKLVVPSTGWRKETAWNAGWCLFGSCSAVEQTPATPWSYSNNDVNLQSFSFFAPCQDTYPRCHASSVQRRDKIHSLGGCCFHYNCRFTPCRVYLHQAASNPRKKKNCYKMHCKCMLTVLGGEEAS